MNKNNKSETILKYAVEGIEARERDGIPLDQYLDDGLKNDPALRKTITSLLFSYYRNKAVIDRLIKELAPKVKNQQKRVIAAACTQIFFMDGISPESAVNVAVAYAKRRYGSKPAGFINAVLRKAGTVDINSYTSNIPLESRLNACPELVKRWKKIFSTEQLRQLADALKSPPAMTFRALKPLPKEELEELQATPLELPEWAGQNSFYSCAAPGKLIEKSWTSQGMIYIQDPATALAPYMAKLNKEHLVLDMCAAPGGKSLMLAEKVNDGNVFACDRSYKRQLLTRENFINSGSNNHVITASALEPPFRNESFDLILLDVPCSNTGVGRHRPDALWSFSASKFDELKELQRNILNTAANLLKPGGQLIYSTCSIEKEENNLQISAFIADNPEFTLVQETQLLPTTIHDGAYAAGLRKVQ
ncbi:MAG: RsmB/NOP family class I SAM-dependent RNA methyltransferase [Victivallales bacterium]|nr:RsmB/NOP family class I SAM-dependent RNA methyltransferase [Victivallales bacterium]